MSNGKRAAGDSPELNRIDLIGEIRATDLDGFQFTLRLSDGRKVTGRFRPDHESAILEALREHDRRRIRVRGTGRFSPEDSVLKEIIDVEWIAVVGSESTLEPVTRIWERLALIGKNAPSEAWNDVPADLAQNVDRYLYGRKEPL